MLVGEEELLGLLADRIEVEEEHQLDLLDIKVEGI